MALVANSSKGIFLFRRGLIRELLRLGIEVHIIAPRDLMTSRLVSDGCEYHPIRINKYSYNPIAEIGLGLRLLRYYRKYKFDWIIHYTIKPNIYGSLAARFVGSRSILMTTGLGRLFSINNPFLQFTIIRLYKWACNSADFVGFLNRDDREIFLQRNLVSQDKIFQLLSEGVDTSYYRPAPFPFQPSKLVFLFAGRIIWHKGVKEFVEAARILRSERRDIQFKMLGKVDPQNADSVPYSQILDWQREGTIEYLGETEDIRPYFRNASCIVLPSFYREGVSRILLEASSMAIPIITTDNVGCREIVTDGFNGLVCESRDTNSLADGMRRFINLQPSERIQMGKNARSKAQSVFDEKLVTRRYLELLGLMRLAERQQTGLTGTEA